MKTRERNKLIKMLKDIVEEIKVFECPCLHGQFFICVDSNYSELIQEYLPAIAEFGKENLDGFEYDYAFMYQGDPQAVEYNECKINHLELYIKHLESIKKEK